MNFPLFDNCSVGSQVTVDLDVFFQYYLLDNWITTDGRSGMTIHITRRKLGSLSEILGIKIPAKYRRSSNGNVHVRLFFHEEISVLDAFMIRAWMFDDQTRLSLDMARYLKTNDLNEMNRCFDEKGTVNGAKKAGEWIPIEVIPKGVEDPQQRIDTSPAGIK